MADDMDADTRWHTLAPDAVVQRQATDPDAGLDGAEAARRLARFGPNALDERGGRTVWHILWEQVSSVLILILVFAGALAAFLGKRADIGVAMGSGTDVAKEAADMVLLDDNFATIVAAVEEGRVVYDNIRRFVQFSVAGNFGKVLTVAVPPFLGLPLLLLPVQILFSNLLTDGLLGLGMGLEKAERDTMRRTPQDPEEGVFSRGMGVHVAWLGGLIGIVTVGVGAWAHGTLTRDGALTPGEAASLTTLVFTTLALIQLGRVQATRSFHDPVWRMNPLGNPALAALVAIAFVLQMTAVYLPAAQPFFHTVPLGADGLAIGLAASALLLLAAELEKAVRRRTGGPAPPAENWRIKAAGRTG